MIKFTLVSLGAPIVKEGLYVSRLTPVGGYRFELWLEVPENDPLVAQRYPGFRSVFVERTTARLYCDGFFETSEAEIDENAEAFLDYWIAKVAQRIFRAVEGIS